MDEPVQVQISGLNKLVRALNKLDDEARDDFKAAGKAAATVVVGEAKRTVPYRTGRLSDTIRAANIARGGRVYAGRARVPYAGPIHFGWGRRNIAPNPFLYRAADRRVTEVMDTYLAHIEKIWNRNI